MGARNRTLACDDRKCINVNEQNFSIGNLARQTSNQTRDIKNLERQSRNQKRGQDFHHERHEEHELDFEIRNSNFSNCRPSYASW